MVYPEIHSWTIACDSPVTDYTESIFSIGNGYLGMRGFDLQTPKAYPQDHAIFRAGFFEPVKPGITDMVQLPDVAGMILEGAAPDCIRQTLDMRSGVLSHRWTAEGVTVCTERMVSMADPSLICVRMMVSTSHAGNLLIHVPMNDWVANLPVHDDQMTEETETIPLLETVRSSSQELTMRAIHSGRLLRFQQSILVNGLPKTMDSLKLHCGAGETVTVEKRVRILLEGERAEWDTSDPWAENARAWAQLWRDCDIRMEAAEEIQGALRWNIFQLLCNGEGKDARISIGARGLTHGRYKGNTFWDMDIFLLPFYCWHRPETAKRLIQFRLYHLPEARQLASRQNLAGARFPWMCAVDGTEQCESWDIGLCETHITADVAYAAERMLEITGEAADDEVRRLWADTARYWRSRFTWEEEKEQFSSFFVKGPDEYCGAAINNTYTNYMARHNVELALRHAGDEISSREREELRFFADHIAILRSPADGTLMQDELLHRMERLPRLSADAEPVYRTICFDRMQRYQALKQADLVQLMVLFPEEFSEGEKSAVWETYEPMTVHDSSLSYGVHAHLAFQLGLLEEGWDYFTRSLLLDLRNGMHTTGREGVHIAALGATWQALVYGAMGLWSRDGRIQTRTALPPQIRQVSLPVWHHGERYRITMNHQETRMEKEA